MNRTSLRERADRLRALPLESILFRWGATRDRADRAKWHTGCGVISVTGAKFMNWTRGAGGGGAIDLAMHLGELSFLEALDWLSTNLPVAAPPAAPATVLPRALLLPSPDERKLPAVRRYLFERRRLPAGIVEPLIAAGTLYADGQANAIFLMRGEEASIVGAEIRGTTARPWRGLARGSRKDLGYFYVPVDEPRTIVLCESAIDAISCAALSPRTLCISTAGARPDPPWLPSILRRRLPVSCGFDADPTGDEMACAMSALHGAVERLRPPLKDWNEVLQALR